MCSFDDVDWEELSGSHDFVFILIPQLNDPLFKITMDYLTTRAKQREYKTILGSVIK